MRPVRHARPKPTKRDNFTAVFAIVTTCDDFSKRDWASIARSHGMSEEAVELMVSEEIKRREKAA